MSVWGFTFAAALFIFTSKFFGRRPQETISGHTVVGRFLGDLHVVHVALAHAGAGDAHELRARAHGGDVLGAGVTHGGAQAAGKLVQDGHEVLELARGVLEVTVGRTVAFAHRPERTHAAIRLVRGALVELDVARRFF